MTGSIEFDYYELPLVAYGVGYTPAEPATLINPGVGDSAEWDLLCLRSDLGKHNLTPIISVTHLDNIEEMICEAFRG